MVDNADFWEQQRFQRATDPNRAPYVVDHVSSSRGGFAYVRGEALADEGALAVLTPPERDRLSVKDASQDWLDGTGLVLLEFAGPPEDLLPFVAEWRATARGADPALRVDLHYVLTGEPAASVPRGGPAGPPWTTVGYVPPKAWGTGDPVVAVLDTGLDPASVAAATFVDAQGASVPHVVFDPDLDTDILGTAPPVPQVPTALLSEAGHGTFIASILARFSGGTARIAALKVLDPDGLGSEQSVVEGLRRLRLDLVERYGSRVAVVNLSLGGFTDDGGWVQDPGRQAALYPAGLRDQMPVGLAAELETWSHEPLSDTVFVCAAGNDGQSDRPFWPAALASGKGPASPPVVAVGSLDGGLLPSSFTNRGPWVSVSTLGEDIVGVYPAGTFDVSPTQTETFDGTGARWSGTSFAAPLVAAEIAARVTSGAAPTGRVAGEDLLVELAGNRVAGAELGLWWDPRTAGPMTDPRV
jgi:hypothetical protein